MEKAFIPRADRYLNGLRKDVNLLDSYGEYKLDEMRGLVGSAVRGFNCLRELSMIERGLRRIENDDVFEGLLEAAKLSFRAVSGSYSKATFIYGKPELIEESTSPVKGFEAPINGHPFLDHANFYVASAVQKSSKRNPICIDTEGEIFGERKIILPSGFDLNGTGEEIGGLGSIVNPDHVAAVYASKRGLISTVLSKDGNVITFASGLTVPDLSYKHDK